MKAVLLIVALARSTLAHAEAADPVLQAATPAERALLEKIDKDQYIKARDEAEVILAMDPGSFIAAWAMARIQHDEEGNHARALYYVHLAQDLLARRYGNPPTWHKKLLLEEYWVLFEMDRNADALAVLDRYEEKYGAGKEALRIWPTFKLGRMDEAREIARKLSHSDEWNDREEGYNGMLSIEFEAHDREASYKWSVEGAAATQDKSCTILRNAAGAAYGRFRLREAEDFALRAPKAEVRCANSGYDQLAGLYLLEGEFQKAVSAIESLKSVVIEKRYRPHFALTRRIILVDLLQALGKVEDSERMAAEVYSLPERTGMTSGSKRMERFVRSFRYWMALDTRLAREHEKASYRPFLSTLGADALRLILVRWEVRRALIQLVADDEILVTITRPNLSELNDGAAWRTMALVDVLGTGVMRSAVAASRVRDAAFPEAAPYLDLFDAEITYKEGDLARAVDQATAALVKLPKEEALLRWRTLAWQADALRRLGKLEAARPLYHEVLQKFPSVLRILDLELPVTVTSDGSPLAAAAAKRAAASSRFEVLKSAPFRVSATSKDGVVELCLTDDGGFQFACAPGEKKVVGELAVESALDAFHGAAFSPRISLKQSDLNSLDGSPVRASADQVLKGVLEP